MLHSPDNHLTGKHLQRFYDYHSPKRRLESKNEKAPPKRGILSSIYLSVFYHFG